MESLQYLTIYLNDHRAGAAAGTDLARRLWRKNRSEPWAAELNELRKSIKAEKETLDAVRASVGVTGGQLRRAGVFLAERASRLKPNGHFLRYSPLTRLTELEALMSGVQSKQRLWAALHQTTAWLPDLARFDFVALGQQSMSQLTILGEIHEWAARQCFQPISNR
jgi:hypothetical protein